MAGKSRQQKKKRAKMQKQINDGLRQKAPNVPKVVEVTAEQKSMMMKAKQLEEIGRDVIEVVMAESGILNAVEEGAESLRDGAEPPPPNVNEDAQRDAAIELPTCGRCYEEVGELFTPNCAEKPEKLIGQPLGQYHCPNCGAMVIAGVPHPKLCKRCLEREHPGFDVVNEEKPFDPKSLVANILKKRGE